MKKLISIVSAAALVSLGISCSDPDERYVDLTTGQSIELTKDETSGIMVNAETKKAPYIYVDTKKHDTIYGKTGKVINGHVIKGEDQKYVYDEDEKLKIEESGAVKYKDGDYKVEVEKDGDMKIKNGDTKTKIDGETGEKKTKKD